MHKLNVKINQHTPLIHFQYEQEGATLRATELKPKLDKFLIRKFNKDGKSFSTLLTGNAENKAFDYKLRIVPLNPVEILDVETSRTNDKRQLKKQSFPAFFANMGDEAEIKKFSFCKTLNLEFMSFHQELLDSIENCIAEFLARNNFGTRQSKGFGSFYVDKNCESSAFKKIKQFFEFGFSVNTNEKDIHKRSKDLFEYIDLFYRAMRSGINQKGKGNVTTFYFKSLLFLYAKHKGWQWDKKTIKQKFFSNAIADQAKQHEESDVLEFESQEKYLLRDLFGLSSDENWLSYRTSISKENGEIDRFKSPILFKPIKTATGFDVFFRAIAVNKDFLDSSFKIKAKEYGELNLKTPYKFSFQDFFDFIFYEHDEEIEEFGGTYFNISTHVEEHYKSNRIYKILDEIFESINHNLVNNES